VKYSYTCETIRDIAKFETLILMKTEWVTTT